MTGSPGTLRCAGIMLAIVLVKTDLSADADESRRQAARSSLLASTVAVNALDEGSFDQQPTWLRPSDTSTW